MMPRYDVYKDSGIEWIGEIPEHWEMTKLKYLGKSLIGLSYQPDEIVDDDSQGILVLRSSNIQNGKLSLLDNVYVKSKVKDEIKVREGDILICSRNGSRSLIGKNITISGELVGNTFGVFMTVFRTPNYKFISKVLNSRVFAEQSGSFLTSTINQLTQDTLNNFFIPFTQVDYEQTQIVEFLDEKTSLIDKLIFVKQRKIELLKEKRTALINNAVTKGLDPNVKMKESAIEWIGEIPEHWEVKKMKYGVYNSTLKANPPSDAIKISPENVESGTGICLNYYSAYEGEGFPFIKGDILFNKLRIYLKKILFADFDGFSMGEMIVLRCNTSLCNRYLYYLLFNQGLIDLLDSQSTGIKMPRVSPEIILNSKVIYPPISEQTQIVEFLDEKTTEIDNLLTLEQKKIDLLKEYRQSLISEVVTGKIKVTKD